MRSLKIIARILVAVCLLLPAAGPAVADSLYITPATMTTDGYTFTSAEMATMKYYIRIDKPNPMDMTGATGFNLAGTWYYIGETTNGVTQWPSNNQITPLLISYGFAGQAVRFTVSQVFLNPADGVERESDLSEYITWTSDASAPYVDTFSPGNGATGVPVGTTSFSFHFKDSGAYAKGANSASLSVNCPGYGAAKTCAVGLNCSGTSSDYTITYPGLSLHNDNVVSCTITGADLESPPNVMTPQTYTFAVAAASPPPVQIITTTLPSATVGASYSAPIVVTGGQSPYHCDNTGVLPPGIPLIAACSFGPGTGTAEGTYAFTVTATGAGGSGSDNQAYTLTVLPATPGGQGTTTVLDNTVTFINRGSPTVNYADNSWLETYVWPAGVESNVILAKGSTSGVPDNVDIFRVVYRLYVTGFEGSGGDNMSLYIQPVTGAVSIDNVTWANFGGNRGTPGAAVVVGLSIGWVEFDITAIAKAAYLNSRAQFMFSIGSRTGGVVDQNRIFASSANANAALRPNTVFTYTVLVAPGGPSVPAKGKARFGPGSRPRHFK